VVEDFERCYRAVKSRDPRFDGWFFTAVTSTGIYCRPSCPARTPAPHHVRFYPSAAAAQQAGFRPCLRCRPDATPGSPEWQTRADVVGRSMRLIADGVVDREGVTGLAARLGYGTRHLHRLLSAEVGAGPLALARAQRAQAARLLVETTDLSMATIAFAAGFSSVRQFNDTVRHVLGRTPGELRRRAPGARDRVPGTISLRLSYRQPMAAAEVLTFLGARAVPGVETADDGTYSRSLRLPHGLGTVALSAADGHVAARMALDDLRDLAAAVTRCRRLLDLDADPEAVDAALGEDPALRRLVRSVPGRRVPGAVDGFELAVRAVVGQQVSVSGARAVAARLVATAGQPLVATARPVADAGTPPAPSHAFPAPAALAEAPDSAFAMPASRRDALRQLAAAVAGGRLTIDAGADPDEVSEQLLGLRGIGPWTVAYVRMRALGDPDAFLPTDLGVRRGLARLGYPGDPVGAERTAARWRPWRAYATTHLWATEPPSARSPACAGEQGEQGEQGEPETTPHHEEDAA
jgi:AraC family transcriptional regulator, regulatory protein of adaptative response / DNA-3-methyladenine glycosylase II